MCVEAILNAKLRDAMAAPVVRQPEVKRKQPKVANRNQQVMGKEAARHLRECTQRLCARARYTAARKLLPKSVRARDVREAQRLRRELESQWEARQVYDDAMKESAYADFLHEEQGGLGVPRGEKKGPKMGTAVTTAAAVVVAGLVGKLSLHIVKKGISTVKRVGTVFNKVERSAESVEGVLSAITAELSRFKESCISWMGKLWVFPLVLLAIWLLRRVENPIVHTLVAGVFQTLFTGMVWSKIAPFLYGAKEESGLADSMGEILASVFAVSYMPKDAAKFIPELSRRMGNLPRASDGFSKFLQLGMNAVEVCLNFVLARMGKDAIYFGDATEVAVKQWLHDSEVHEADLVKAEPNSDKINRILLHIQDGYVLRSNVNDDKLKTLLVRTCDRLETRMRNYAGSTEALKCFRAEPVMLMLCGRSKQGKTLMLAKLASSILIMAGLATAKNVLSEIWQQGESKYYESYRGQAANVMDDCFQEKFKAGMENTEFMQIIRKINSWSHPCNMASVDLKAKVYFQSKLVIGTTNINSIYETNINEVINCPDAIIRRIRSAIHIEAALDFQVMGDDGKLGLDYHKLTAAIEEGEQELKARIANGYKHSVRDVIASYPWHAWDVTTLDFATGATGARVDMVDFIIETAEELVRRQKHHLSTIDRLNSFNELLETACGHAGEERSGASAEEQAGCFGDEDDLFGTAYDSARPCLPSFMQRDSSYEPQDFPAEEQSGYHDARCREAEEKMKNKVITLMSMVRSASHIMGRDCSDMTADQLLAAIKQEIIACHPDRRARAEREGRDTTRMTSEYVAQLNGLLDALRVLAAELKDAEDFYVRAKYEASDAAQRERTWREKLSNLARIIWYDITHSPLLRGIFSEVVFITQFVLSAYIIKKLIEFVTYGAKAVFHGFRALIPGLKSPEDDEKPQRAPQEEPMGEQSNINDKPKAKSRGKPWKTNVVAQGYDGTQVNQLSDIVYNNTYKLIMASDGKSIGQMVMIKDQMAAMPHHFMRQLSSNVQAGNIAISDKILLIRADQSENHRSITVGDFLNLRKCGSEECDISFVEFSHRVLPPGKDIRGHMFRSEVLERAVKTRPSVRLDVARPITRKDGTIALSRHTMYASHSIHKPELVVGAHTKRDLLEYEMSTQVGDCGAPLSMMDPRCFNGKSFIGFHVAGKPGVFTRYGFGTPVTLDMVEDAILYFKPKVEDISLSTEPGYDVKEVDAETQSALQEAGLLAGSFTLIGEVSQPIHTPPFTKLKATPINKEQLLGEFTHKPAHLRSVLIEGELRHPMVEGLRNYQSQVHDVQIEGLTACVAIATLPFRRKTINEPRFIFDFPECVRGVEGLKIKTINRSTSAGFPYVLYNSKPGKKDFFGDGDDFELTSERCIELEGKVNAIIENARQGKRMLHLCTDFLKDELRPPHKVDACQTRVISGSPLDYVLAVRMYFGAFIAACFRHNIDTGLCPGINPYQEWWRLADHLRSNCKTKVFDGDFKRFDASEQPVILWAILDFINEWYDDGDDNRLIREVLWLDVVQSRHLSGYDGELKYIIQWSKSLPSGHPLTTIINSWYSMFALTIAYMHTTGNVSDMWNHISPATFGDDNITGVDDEVCDLFNQVTVAKVMKEVLNLEYTSGSKDGTLVPYKTLEECTFLKRSFLRSDDNLMGGWCAPLAKESFLFTTYYTKSKSYIAGEYADKLEATLGELSLHPEATWEEYYPKVKSVMEIVGSVPSFIMREDYRKLTASRADCWF